jgi:hypothetical protein
VQIHPSRLQGDVLTTGKETVNLGRIKGLVVAKGAPQILSLVLGNPTAVFVILFVKIYQSLAILVELCKGSNGNNGICILALDAPSGESCREKIRTPNHPRDSFSSRSAVTWRLLGGTTRRRSANTQCATPVGLGRDFAATSHPRSVAEQHPYRHRLRTASGESPVVDKQLPQVLRYVLLTILPTRPNALIIVLLAESILHEVTDRDGKVLCRCIPNNVFHAVPEPKVAGKKIVAVFCNTSRKILEDFASR